MKRFLANFRQQLAGLSLAVLALGVGSLALLAQPASAQPNPQSWGDPVINGFDVKQPRKLTPGTTLPFTLYGTPGGRAQLNIGGTSGNYYLNEVSAGVYEGSYTVRAADRFNATTGVTANLRVGNKVATATLNESLLAGAAWRPSNAPATSAVPNIDRFSVAPVRSLEPGADIQFALVGTPGGDASVRINGVEGKIFLAETTPGNYQGSYVVNGRDRIASAANVTALLRIGKRSVTSVQRNALASAAGTTSPVAAVRCLNCGVIEAVNAVEVKGDGSYLGLIAGGVAGAVLGSQVGKGSGRTAASILGAAGGAYAGREIEGRVRNTTHYEMVVRLDSGGVQTVTFPSPPQFAVGNRVRVDGATVTPI